MASLIGKLIIRIHILPNISESKSNQVMKFGQLIENYMKDIFHEEAYTKYGGETSRRSFSKKLKLSVTLDQQAGILYSMLFLYNQVKDYQNMFSLYGEGVVHLLLHHIKPFQKTKKRSRTSFPASFSS